MRETTRICFVRHGQTDWNLQGRIQGQTDIPLNECGKSEAQQVAERIRLESWDVCYASDLIRAADTASTISERVPNLSLIFDPRLRERNYGVIEGMEPNERDSTFGKDWRDRIEELGIESKEHLVRRMVSWSNEIRLKHSGENVIVVTHGGWIRAYFLYLFQQLPDTWLSNGSLSVLRCRDADWTCELYNDFSHIRPIVSEKSSVYRGV